MVLEGPLRKRLREGRLLKQSPNPGNAETPKIPRKVLTDLIFDEEKAHVDYMQLAANPVFNGLQRNWILKIAADEQNHHEILKGILSALEGEGKVV
jgi:hypothetical protein